MSTYKDLLNRARENKIDITNLIIASATEFWMDYNNIKVSDKKFDELCSFAVDCYLKADNIKADSIAQAILYYVKKHDNPLKYDRWDIIDKAYDYED